MSIKKDPVISYIKDNAVECLRDLQISLDGYITQLLMNYDDYKTLPKQYLNKIRSDCESILKSINILTR